MRHREKRGMLGVPKKFRKSQGECKNPRRVQERLEPGPGALRRWGSYRDLGLAWGSGAVTRGAGSGHGGGRYPCCCRPTHTARPGGQGVGVQKKIKKKEGRRINNYIPCTYLYQRRYSRHTRRLLIIDGRHLVQSSTTPVLCSCS